MRTRGRSKTFGQRAKIIIMIYGLVVIIPPSTANYVPAFQNCARTPSHPPPTGHRQIWKFLFRSTRTKRFVIFPFPFVKNLLTVKIFLIVKLEYSTRYSSNTRIKSSWNCTLHTRNFTYTPPYLRTYASRGNWGKILRLRCDSHSPVIVVVPEITQKHNRRLVVSKNFNFFYSRETA